MLKVGLTGSIAVGKSFVATTLKELGCPILDADQTARSVIEPNTIGWQKVIESFGREVLNSDATVNRDKLGAIVFADVEKRLLLNSIVHPLVIEAQNEWLQKQESENAEVAVIDAALMIESGSYRRFDKIIVVWCEPQVQLERLMRRNNLSDETALQRIAAQMPQEEKKRYGDFLINSSSGFEDTRAQVEIVYRHLRDLSS